MHDISLVPPREALKRRADDGTLDCLRRLNDPVATSQQNRTTDCNLPEANLDGCMPSGATQGHPPIHHLRPEIELSCAENALAAVSHWIANWSTDVVFALDVVHGER